jgi:hypothetical protein
MRERNGNLGTPIRIGGRTWRWWIGIGRIGIGRIGIGRTGTGWAWTGRAWAGWTGFASLAEFPRFFILLLPVLQTPVRIRSGQDWRIIARKGKDQNRKCGCILIIIGAFVNHGINAPLVIEGQDNHTIG